MIFRFSPDFTVDTSEEPWKSEGLRIGAYANPGAGKSYTVAIIAEQWLDQGGTVVVFAPRAEWHTLKSHYPVQVVGGPFLQDVPLVASEPALYARVVVEQGVSMAFYTSDIEDEEKLVEFVTRFLAQVIRLQEKHHRPLLLIVEETQEYAPRSPSGHIAPPWVYNRMIKAFKDCFTQGRKLNICPVAISQRPQEVNFTIRQLANLAWFGGFSAQDVGYLDKEVFAHYRKNGVDVKAQDLLSVERGEWLVIAGKHTVKVTVTEKRKTPHGADTPTLDYVQPVGEEVKRAVSELGVQLKEMLDKRAAEESEFQKAKRTISDLNVKMKDLEEKAKLKGGLQALLAGSPGLSEDEVTRRVQEATEKQQALHISQLEAQAKSRDETLEAVRSSYTKALEALQEEVKNLRSRLDAYQGLDEAISKLVGDAIARTLPDEVEKAMAAMPQVRPAPLPEGGEGSLVVEASYPNLRVRVSEPTVMADEKTLRGQIALLIAEGEFDKPISLRSVLERLRLYGYVSLKSGQVSDELAWFTRNRILSNDSHGWKVKDKARVSKEKRTDAV